MIVDSSAILAILRDEPEGAELARALVERGGARISAATVDPVLAWCSPTSPRTISESSASSISYRSTSPRLQLFGNAPWGSYT